jgi:hypothetical protein
MNTDCTDESGKQKRRKFLATDRHGFLHGMNQETKHQGTTAWAAVDNDGWEGVTP